MSERSGFEAIKYALRQSKDGVVVSFVIHPNDVQPELMALPIGARVMVGWAAIAEHDAQMPSAEDVRGIIPQEQEPPEPSEEGKRLVKQCALHCADKRFQSYLANTGWVSVEEEESAAVAVRKICGIKSRKELATNEIAQVKWKSLHAQFRNSLADKDYGTGGYMR